MAVSVHIVGDADKSSSSVAWGGLILVCSRFVFFKNSAIEIALTSRFILPGAQAAIGVFLFGTDSAIDRAVGSGETLSFENRVMPALNMTNINNIRILDALAQN